MDEHTARRLNFDFLKEQDVRTSSGVVPANVLDASSFGVGTGALLAGKYLVGRIIGSGAVGIVFEAKNIELDETVAIKCLRPQVLSDAAIVARFAREAKAASAIKCEYVATVYDVGTTDKGMPYMVMEYLEGKDLGTLVAEGGPFRARAAVEYALQVCEALAVAHGKGLVHRDIKPENLLLAERSGGLRIVKVLDFGISKTALGSSLFQNELPLVKTQNLMGTPLYMSPEQVRVSDSVDVRSDIWSLGMVLYEVLCGQTAFGGSSITEICAAILELPPTPMESYREDLPAGLVEIVMTCLQKDVTKRYQNVAELALALMPFAPKRCRLNAERAVASLRGAGQLDPSTRLESTTPPPHSEQALIHADIPRPPNVPHISDVAGLSSKVTVETEPGGVHSSASPPAVESLPPVRKRSSAMFVLVGIATLAACAVSFFAFERGRSGDPTNGMMATPSVRSNTAVATAGASASEPAEAPARSSTKAAEPPTSELAPKVVDVSELARPKASSKPLRPKSKRPSAVSPKPPASPSTVQTIHASDLPDLGY